LIEFANLRIRETDRICKFDRSMVKDKYYTKHALFWDRKICVNREMIKFLRTIHVRKIVLFCEDKGGDVGMYMLSKKSFSAAGGKGLDFLSVFRGTFLSDGGIRDKDTERDHPNNTLYDDFVKQQFDTTEIVVDEANTDYMRGGGIMFNVLNNELQQTWISKRRRGARSAAPPQE